MIRKASSSEICLLRMRRPLARSTSLRTSRASCISKDFSIRVVFSIAIENTTLMEKSFEMQEALEVRKLVERAKGLLMRSKQISEEEAFRIMQRQSMDTRRSMREIAEAILLAGELEKRLSAK